MSFFKNLFSKSESFSPSPTQQVAGIQPIVVHAIENLFPSIDDQKRAFDHILKLKEKGNTYRQPKVLLAILFYSKGKIDNLLNVSLTVLDDYHFLMDELEPIFPNMKAAENWVQSITKLQA